MSKSQRTSITNRTSTQNNESLLDASFNRKKKYQTLLQEGVTLNERVENSECFNTLAQVRNLIEYSNAISKECADSNASEPKNVANASENLMDAAIVKIGHEIVGTVANKLDKSEFSEMVYSQKILSTIQDGSSLNWSLFAKEIIHTAKTPRFGQSMLGLFDLRTDPIVQPKKERIMRQRAPIAEMKRPEKVVQLQKEEKGAQLLTFVKDQIEREFKLRNYTPLPYNQVICDPNDFMHTIDNAFQVAFLVRDGFLGLTVDENNEPFVYLPTKEQIKMKEHDKRTKQAVVGLSYSKWLNIAARYPKSILKLNRDEFISQSQR